MTPKIVRESCQNLVVKKSFYFSLRRGLLAWAKTAKFFPTRACNQKLQLKQTCNQLEL